LARDGADLVDGSHDFFSSEKADHTPAPWHENVGCQTEAATMPCETLDVRLLAGHQSRQ
jgi:hypothetical protein